MLAEVDDDPERLHAEPNAWVQTVEIPDGNLGAFGQIMSTHDIIKMVVKGEKLPEKRNSAE